jgi:hypothetical protein
MSYRIVFMTLLIVATAAHAESLPQADGELPPADEFRDTAAGHGTVSVVYLDSYVNGMWLTPHSKAPIGTVRDRGLGVDASYNVSNDWSIYGGIRYFNNVLKPPGAPEQRESAWQDITLGAAWHKRIGGYDFTPSVTASIPSHDYSISSDAYTGQRLHQLLFAATLSHQFDFTNLYYKLGYGYAFSQHVFGVNTGYQRADAELGWFVNDRFSVRTFLTGRDGFGVSYPEFGPLVGRYGPDVVARKIQLAEHSYHAWGLGADYDFGNRYVASFNVQHMFWGNLANDLKYAVEARLTRSF